ncbi:TPA: hypothetical protein N0F65_007604 [Lagenidium giganteum]|uniref:Adenylate cyclase n=1 Tax=Lagenidium giganteum TaxID=4803 RepID=A0AAV2ZNF5_9STRA|nr:TPA: hypothetical protein N0F65_007604 [Lagenidium giganteum]
MNCSASGHASMAAPSSDAATSAIATRGGTPGTDSRPQYRAKRHATLPARINTLPMATSNKRQTSSISCAAGLSGNASPPAGSPPADRTSAGARKELDVRLSAYLPAVVRRYLERQDQQRVPDTHETTVVSMFADVSGFTAMTESLAARGPVGAEYLAKHLNSYFEQLLRLVSSSGGDVFKFAGDAMLIFWPENKEDTLESLLRRSVQCALRIQEHLHKAELAPGVVLSVKMGIGIGGATIAHLGGESDGSTARMEYVAVGPALEQAFNSEHQAEAGDVICSPEAWKLVHPFFDGEPVRSGTNFHKVKQVTVPVRNFSRRPSFTRDDAQLHRRMKQYVSRAVWPYLDALDEFWGSELREVTVLFINLGFSEEDLAKMLDSKGLQKLQDAFALVQKCIYEYEGTINKFLVDDKGSTVIAAFGLPPVTHENDPVRGILASLAICAALGKLGLKASVGITSGAALCGVVGHQGNRREYTVLGDIVNLSARLMQKAKSERGGVITDESTKLYAQDVLHFEERPEIMVKGKNDSIKIHRPYPRMSILLEYHLSLAKPTAGLPGNRTQRTLPTSTTDTPLRPTPIPNVMENMHRVQVRDAQRRISVRAELQAANTEAIIESDHFVKVRDSLLEKCSHLNRFSPGGAFVLEGDIGLGKTVLLRSTLSCPEAGCYNILQATATPFATRKPYAIWAEILSKCALENFGDSESQLQLIQSPSDSSVASNSSTTSSTNVTARNNDISREVVRRKQVAIFVRRKIKEGAAPNTKLVEYAPLLNSILDTDFDELADREAQESMRASGRTPSIRLLDTSNNIDDPEKSDGENNQEEEGDDADDSDSESDSDAVAVCVPGSLGSPNSQKVKEEAIAAWFLGLLEMDLAMNQRESDDRSASSIPTTSVATHEDGEGKEYEERESEWRPTDLDLSGILLLCALYAISRDRSTIFCLDNAMYMDEKSWILTTIITKYFTNCLVVIGTRPPSMALTENTQSSSFRKQLRVVKKMNNTTCEVMEPLENALIERLALQILKVRTIPGELMSILLSRSQGNALFLREIISEMIQQQVINVDSKRQTCTMQVQEPWGEKCKTSYCFHCYTKFAASKDKHRCKCCGYVFCTPCTPKACRKKLPGSTGDAVRHCCNCYALSSTRRPSSDRNLVAAANAIAAGTMPTRQKSRMRSIFLPSDGAQTPAQSLKNRVALRPPRTVKSVLTTLLDQLTVSQRMIMKTASVVGPTFEEELLRGSCPIKAHLAHFAQDIAELERLAMIRRIDTFIGGVPSRPASSNDIKLAAASSTGSITCSTPHLKVKFEFNHGFMQDVIRGQMLSSQLDKLNARITDYREQQQKELRHKFFEKAKGSLNRSLPITLSSTHLDRHISSGDVYALATQNMSNQGNRGSNSPPLDRNNRKSEGNASSGAVDVGMSTSQSTTAPSSSEMTVARTGVRLFESPPASSSFTKEKRGPHASPKRSPVLKPIPTFVRLKYGPVFVRKQSSVFSHFKGWSNATMWKKRYAVLQNARLVLQYDEMNGSQPRRCTSLFLKGAKVSPCDPDVAAKVNCFQVEVNEWTKGKYLINQKRFFVIGVESDAEVDHWVYMVKYAIESLENQSE